MLEPVTIERHCSSSYADDATYRMLVGDELMDRIRELAGRLRGIRICHINSTAYGGGVAELLTRHLPVLRALGLEVDWRIIHGPNQFFTITKTMHNALQGMRRELSEEDRDLYLRVNQEAAARLPAGYDVVVVHDPQPAAIRHFAADGETRWIWRCHIDSSHPDPQALEFLRPYIEEYDLRVFTMEDFVPAELRTHRVALVAPAIDPLATKNMDLPMDLCRRAIADHGIDTARPLLVQVSRFDPWKDPLGVIRAWRLVREEIPGVQLALIGAMAGDDPEGWALLEQVEKESAAEPDLFVFNNLAGVGAMGVNVFQRGCDVVIQKSIREGFGLVVSEALWKERPVVAGRAGGIPLQFPEGFESYLVDSVEACAERIVDLLRHPGRRGDLGRAGREHVRRHFLLPRLVRDELELVCQLVHDGS